MTDSNLPDRFAFIGVAPGFDVLAVPSAQGNDLFLDLLATTPYGTFRAQAQTTRAAWQQIKRGGAAKFGPTLDRWFHFLMGQMNMPSGHGRVVPPTLAHPQDVIDAPCDCPYASGNAQAAQGGAGVGDFPPNVDGSWPYLNNAWNSNDNNSWNPNLTTWWNAYRYYPVRPRPIFPVQTLPPQSGYNYPLGLPTYPMDPSAENSRRYAWAFPPFSSDWMASLAFCPPGGCGIG